MLQNLYVKNLALIDETEVEFGPGLNVLTGETGAGKSLLLGSVNLALGGKYSADMLRSGTKSGLVELTFTVEDKETERKLAESDIFPEDGCVTLSRRLMEGRSVSRINGETVNMGVLRDVASLLIDIHGQHENQTLLHRKNHLSLLDLFAREETEPLRGKMAGAFGQYRKLLRQSEESALDEESRRKEASLAEFEVKEIEDAAPVPGEDDDLEERYRRMTESRRITEAVAEAYQYSGNDMRGNASELISRAIRVMQDVSEFDTLAEYRDDIRAKLLERKTQEAKREKERKALDKAVDIIENQVVRHKGRMRSKVRQNIAFKAEYEAIPVQEDILPEEDDAIVIEKNKHFELRPMDVEEAVMQMELLGHTFFVFLNMETDTINVVYKRKNGSYGLIEPEY